MERDGRHWRKIDMILAGDIGATNSRLAAFETEGNRLQCVVEKDLSQPGHNGLAEIVADFTRTEGIPAQSRALASPARCGGRSKISNLPWIIDSRELAAQLKLRTVGLINDLEAFAYGIDALESKDFVTLSEGATTRRATPPWSRPAPGWARPVSTGTDSAIIPSPAKAGTPNSLPRTIFRSSCFNT